MQQRDRDAGTPTEHVKPVEGAPQYVNVDRTGPAVWAALEGEARTGFEDEFREALAKTAEDFDVARLAAVVEAWWPVAFGTVNPASEQAQADLERYRSGDRSGVVPAPVLGEKEPRWPTR
ncbi:DUF6247 family protein [Crossiella sp. CA198]|uniref:DUF6247 family protein n=1 Tax=Crossiella sp. CA198 TaxID=3455607 RepID=UPI003F8D2575